MVEKRIMSIDYGEARIGIALSDPLLTFAYPYLTLKNDTTLLKNIKSIVSEKNVCLIILGLPSSLKTASANLANKVREFGMLIKNELNLEIIFWDEEYTSVIAEQRIKESITSKKKRRNKGLIDQNAAAIILQEYLDKK